MSRQLSHSDGVDARRLQWTRECPEIDTTGMAVLGRMRAITLAVRPAIEAVFARYGLDSGEFDVLATLLRSGPPYRLRPTELYRSLMVSSGGMTDRLARLVKLGNIVRTASPNDARSLLVELTEQGRTIARDAFTEDMALEAQIVETLCSAEREQLAGLLRKLMITVETPVPAPLSKA